MIKIFLNHEEEKNIKTFLLDLTKYKKLTQGDSISSGGLEVCYEGEDGNALYFSIKREIGDITISKKEFAKLKTKSKKQ